MPRHSTRILGRIVKRIARLSPPCQHDLVQGIVAELDSIADPSERTRFALGAIIAIGRLALSPRTGGNLRLLLKTERRYDKSYFAMVGIALLPALGVSFVTLVVGSMIGGSESVLDLVSRIVFVPTFFAACHYIRARQTPTTT